MRIFIFFLFINVSVLLYGGKEVVTDQKQEQFDDIPLNSLREKNDNKVLKKTISAHYKNFSASSFLIKDMDSLSRLSKDQAEAYLNQHKDMKKQLQQNCSRVLIIHKIHKIKASEKKLRKHLEKFENKGN